MEILKYEDLHHGGFAGLEERRFVMDRRVFGRHKNTDAIDGLGNFVYLADANFLPKGQTGLHPHREIDVISVMVAGRIHHEGSLEHGQSLKTGTVQVQRAGGEGFTHNEINPDDVPNNMIQLWVVPDEQGEPAGYQTFEPKPSGRTHFYGGSKGQGRTFYSRTQMDIVNLEAGETLSQDGDAMAYFTKGTGIANGASISPRTLIRADGLDFKAAEASQLILIYTD
jgi:redox-sensitive bicupin YhaK (pirin superfamily)